MDEQKGIDRLRTAAAGASEQSAAWGAAAGRDWAIHTASPQELARLEEAKGRRSARAYATACAADPRGLAARLFADIAGVPLGEEIDPADIDALWGDGDAVRDATAAAAFIDAALAVWVRAKP